jgi:hypothetical protein
MGKKMPRKTQESEKLLFGLAWYKPEQWARLREIAADAGDLEETFEEWRAIAEKAMRDFEARFVFPEKVLVDVEELLVWCRERKLPVNGTARSQYVAWLLKKRDKAGGKE